MPTLGFPLPLIGNSIKIVDAVYKRNHYSKGAHTELYDKAFVKKPPKIFAEFTLYMGNVVITDPELAHEFWGPNHSRHDKHPKLLRIFSSFNGVESLVF